MFAPGQLGCRQLAAGEHLCFLLIDLRLDKPLPRDHWIGYAVALRSRDSGDERWLFETDVHLNPGSGLLRVVTSQM